MKVYSALVLLALLGGDVDAIRSTKTHKKGIRLELTKVRRHKLPYSLL